MRYTLLDGLRGLTIVSMVIYHAVWDMINIFNIMDDEGWKTELFIWQQSICWSFIFLSGFCSRLGSGSIRRGMQVFLWGAVISALTIVLMPKNGVLFGVLTFIGSAMMIVSLCRRLPMQISPVWGFISSLVLFILLRNTNRGFLGFGSWNLYPLPDSWYDGMFATYLGFTDGAFSSSDYFSLFTWLFLFLSGYFACSFCKRRNRMQIFCAAVPSSWQYIGRHSLGLYLLHQPVIYGVISAWQYVYSYNGTQ